VVPVKSKDFSISIESMGVFWCEASVLVAVFGLLDKIVKAELVSPLYAGKTLSAAVLFFWMGIVLKTWAKS